MSFLSDKMKVKLGCVTLFKASSLQSFLFYFSVIFFSAIFNSILFKTWLILKLIPLIQSLTPLSSRTDPHPTPWIPWYPTLKAVINV